MKRMTDERLAMIERISIDERWADRYDPVDVGTELLQALKAERAIVVLKNEYMNELITDLRAVDELCDHVMSVGGKWVTISKIRKALTHYYRDSQGKEKPPAEM
jgi:FMN phosphatase YigB (HAD superfamily)